MIVIPMIDQNDFVVEADLEGSTYFLRLMWNSEAGYWVMGMGNANNETVLFGLPLVPNTPLLAQWRHLRLPRGEFVASADDHRECIGRVDFLSGQATLYYLTELEYAAL